VSIESQLGNLVGSLPDGVSEGVALGAGLADGYNLYESAIGDVAVTFNPGGVSSVDIADQAFEDRFVDRFGRKLIRAEAPSAWSRHIPAAIEAGTPGKLPIDLRSVTSQPSPGTRSPSSSRATGWYAPMGISATTPLAARTTNTICWSMRVRVPTGWKTSPQSTSVSRETLRQRSSATRPVTPSDVPRWRTWSTSAPSTRRRIRGFGHASSAGHAAEVGLPQGSSRYR